MAIKERRKKSAIEVVAPLFDRLKDLEPSVDNEAIPLKVYSITQVVESIARELDNLLNTRSSRVPYSLYASREDLAQDELSHTYGLPDFAQFDVADSAGQDLLVRQIKRLVDHYESRLSNIGVRILGSDENKRLIVEVSGIINVFETPERYTFPLKIKDSI